MELKEFLTELVSEVVIYFAMWLFLVSLCLTFPVVYSWFKLEEIKQRKAWAEAEAEQAEAEKEEIEGADLPPKDFL